jgi:hypothetical protein
MLWRGRKIGGPIVSIQCLTMAREYYSETIPDFVGRDPTQVLGSLAEQHQFALEEAQKHAWMAQIQILKMALQTFRSGHTFLSIPFRVWANAWTIFFSYMAR